MKKLTVEEEGIVNGMVLKIEEGLKGRYPDGVWSAAVTSVYISASLKDKMTPQILAVIERIYKKKGWCRVDFEEAVSYKIGMSKLMVVLKK